MPRDKLEKLAALGEFRGYFKYGFDYAIDHGPTGQGQGGHGNSTPPYSLGPQGDMKKKLGEEIETWQEKREKEKEKKAAKKAWQKEKKRRREAKLAEEAGKTA